jgi:hypothetical protein
VHEVLVKSLVCFSSIIQRNPYMNMGIFLILQGFRHTVEWSHAILFAGLPTPCANADIMQPCVLSSSSLTHTSHPSTQSATSPPTYCNQNSSSPTSH